MSALPTSKKKKLIRIIIVIASLVEGHLDNNFENSNAERILDLTAQAYIPLLDVPDTAWTEDQADAWGAYENLHDYLVNSTNDDDEELGSYANDLEEKLSRC